MLCRIFLFACLKPDKSIKNTKEFQITHKLQGLKLLITQLCNDKQYCWNIFVMTSEMIWGRKSCGEPQDSALKQHYNWE